MFVTDTGARVGAVQIASSDAPDTRTAVTRVLDDIDASTASAVFLFYAPQHDPEIVAELLHGYIGDRGIAGSTAGEIASDGFVHGNVVALALHGPNVRCAITVLPSLSEISLLPVTTIAADLAERIGRSVETLDPDKHIWTMLFDGLSGQEDFITPFFMKHAPRLRMVGGSFGDEERFEDVTLVHNGTVHRGAGAVMLLEYDAPFEVLHHTHHEFTEHWFRVTKTARGGRVLLELDGKPAKEVYAEALGLEVADLELEVTGENGFGYRFKGRPFPCGVMRALPEGLLVAYSMQVGDRINLLRPVGLVEKAGGAISEAIGRLESRGGQARGMLAFNCMGRYLEARGKGLREPLFAAMHQLPIAGLNTYGEQYSSRHMNLSLTGIVFG